MASLSIDESSSSSPSVKPSATSSVETASPTVIVPSSLQTEKRTESDCPAASATAGSAYGSAVVTAEDAPPSTASPSGLMDPDTPDGCGKDGGKKKKNRCLSCKKKVGLTGFTCRCGGLFCSIHRYSDKHECNFDYKELGAEEIRKSNPVVVAKKVQKI